MGAPLNPVPQVLRVFLEGFVDNDLVYKWGNVLHFGYTGTPPNNATCLNLAADIASEWGTYMAPECPAPTQLTSVSVTDLTSDTAGEATDFVSVVGTRGDDSIPANAAMLVSYNSGLRYKGGHPRNYLYVGGNADLEGAAHWSGAFTTEVEGHWRNFLSHCVGTVESGCTLSSVGFVRYRGKYMPNGGPPHYYLDTPLYQAFEIDLATTHAEIASQRRRVGRRKS